VIAPGASKSGANSIYSHLLPNVKDQDKRKPAPTPRWSFDDGKGGGVGQPKAGGGASAKRGPPQQAMPLGAEQQQPQQQQQRIEDMYYDEEPGCCGGWGFRVWCGVVWFEADRATYSLAPRLVGVCRHVLLPPLRLGAIPQLHGPLLYPEGGCVDGVDERCHGC
jgi:hypothetical protein